MKKGSFAVIFILVSLILVLFPRPGVYPLNIRGECSRVLDGDTIITQGKRIRLVYIDAPESDQWDKKRERPVGRLSTNYLKKLCLNKEITLRIVGKGRYGRYLAEIFEGNKSLNFEMVKKGMAFLYGYSVFESPHQKKVFQKMYKRAKKKKLGIFKSRVLRPRTYRKNKRLKTTTK